MAIPSKSTEIQEAVLYGSPDYYLELFDDDQKGGHSLPFFHGTYAQRGHGFLSDFIMQYAVPALKRAAPHLLHGVSKVISDVRKGKDLGESVKKRGSSSLKRAATSAFTGGQAEEDQFDEPWNRRAQLIGQPPKKRRKKTGKKHGRSDFPVFA